MVGLGSIISGALGGLFGIGQKFIELKEKKLEAEERDKDRAHDLLVMEKEGELAEKKLRIQQEMTQDQFAGEAFVQSQIYGNQSALPANVKLSKNQTWWLVVIEAISKAVRPVSTIYYQLAMTGVFIWTAWVLSGVTLPVEKITNLQEEIIFAFIYLAEMTIGWWFGVSAIRKRSK